MKSKIKRNLVIITLGLILSFGLVYMLQNTSLLQASILSLSDYNTIKKNKWDMAYKTQNNSIEIFCSDTLTTKDIEKIKIHLVYNDVIIQRKEAEYQNNIKIISPVSGESYVTMNNISNIDCKKSLIDIPFDGLPENLIVNRITTDYTTMKIGNLNTKTIHGE